MKKFKNRTVLITGGTRGIGREIVQKFSEQNFNVIFTYNKNAEVAKNIVSKLSQINKKIYTVKMNLIETKNIISTMDFVAENYGNVDILINNAAIAQEKDFMRIDLEDWDRMMAINLRSVFLLSKLSLPNMIKNKWGRIINISSIGGQWGGVNQVHYAASKAGLINFTQSVAKIYSKHGITSNAIAPGLFETEMSKREINSTEGQNKLKNIPIGRFGKISEIASTALFLSSNGASYITGQTLNLNGGMLFS